MTPAAEASDKNRAKRAGFPKSYRASISPKAQDRDRGVDGACGAERARRKAETAGEAMS